MDVKLRPGRPEDTEVCGRIIYEAFGAISGEHNFPSDFPAPEIATGLASMLLGHPGLYSVIAEVNGKVVGSNFLDERSTISGVGPVTVDPAAQNNGVGRILMQDVIQRAAERAAPGIRLLQDAYHGRSLSLYEARIPGPRRARLHAGHTTGGRDPGLPGPGRHHHRRRGVHRCMPSRPRP
jgi:predicted N-acetyltransferase YhbS